MDDPKSGALRVLRDGYPAYEIPSRQCLVCDRLERPGATIVNEGEAWLCPECKSRIKKLIYNDGLVKKVLEADWDVTCDPEWRDCHELPD